MHGLLLSERPSRALFLTKSDRGSLRCSCKWCVRELNTLVLFVVVLLFSLLISPRSSCLDPERCSCLAGEGLPQLTSSRSRRVQQQPRWQHQQQQQHLQQQERRCRRGCRWVDEEMALAGLKCRSVLRPSAMPLERRRGLHVPARCLVDTTVTRSSRVFALHSGRS